MITGNHVREELDKAIKIVNSIKEASLEAIIKLQKLTVKLLTVIIKITINNRGNTKKIMDKLNIKDGLVSKPYNYETKEIIEGDKSLNKMYNKVLNKIEIDEDIIENINKGE